MNSLLSCLVSLSKNRNENAKLENYGKNWVLSSIRSNYYCFTIGSCFSKNACKTLVMMKPPPSMANRCMVVNGKGSICRATSSMQKNVAATWRIVVVGTGLALAIPSK